MKTLTMKRRRYIANTCLFLLVVLFSYTAINKVFTLSRFQFQLSKFPWLDTYPRLTAWAVISSEIAAVGLLLTPRRILTGFVVSFCLLSLFTTYLLIMLLTSPYLPCTCGGVLEQLSWPQHLGLNLLCIGISILGFVNERRIRYSSQINLSL